MSKGIRRALILLAIGGAAFQFASFGPRGCAFANNQDFDDMFAASGEQVIRTVSSNYFRFGTDWDTVVRLPTTDFAVAVWNNYLDAKIPDDLPNNQIVLR